MQRHALDCVRPCRPCERPTMTEFKGIVPALAEALEKRGYAALTPVQKAVLAPEAEGADMLVSAQTGSGKTVAFGLALAPTLLDGACPLRPGRRAAGAGDRADARTRHPGQARTRLALRGNRRQHRLLRRRHGHAQRAPRARTRRAYRGRHAGPPARPHHAQLARPERPARRRARRGRRDARPRLPRGSRIHPRRRTRPTRRTLLFSATIPRAIADARQDLPARRAAHRRPRPSSRSMSTSNTAR